MLFSLLTAPPPCYNAAILTRPDSTAVLARARKDAASPEGMKGVIA
jgi:hypothetical protein